jgi:hypothetical protein
VKKERKKMNIELKEKPENKQKDENLNMTNMESINHALCHMAPLLT